MIRFEPLCMSLLSCHEFLLLENTCCRNFLNLVQSFILLLGLLIGCMMVAYSVVIQERAVCTRRTELSTRLIYWTGRRFCSIRILYGSSKGFIHISLQILLIKHVAQRASGFLWYLV